MPVDGTKCNRYVTSKLYKKEMNEEKKRQISREKSGKLDETDEKNTIQLN